MLPTRRLYEEDPYLTECTAAVVCCTPDESLPGYWSCALEATVFYPEGGGQPCDLGTLDAEPVLAVHLDGEGVIWHRTARPLPEGQTVTEELTGTAASTTCSSTPASTSSAARCTGCSGRRMWASTSAAPGCGWT